MSNIHGTFTKISYLLGCKTNLNKFKKTEIIQNIFSENNVLCIVAQLCPTLCDPMDCSLPGSSGHGDSPGKNTGVDCHALLQGSFLTLGSNPGILHCRQILYHLRYHRIKQFYRRQIIRLLLISKKKKRQKQNKQNN